MASSPKPPKPVDPNEAAAAQARWNRINTRGPGGSVTWEGEGPGATQVTQWDPRVEALFSQMEGIAGQERDRYASPEGFASYRDGIVSRLNDRQQMGRPVYQPTQTIGGTLGPNSQANGPALGGPSQAAPQEPPMTIQPVQEPGGPQIGIGQMGGMNKPPTDLTAYTTGKPSVPFIGGGGGVGGGMGGGSDGQFTQPVPPGGKNLGFGAQVANNMNPFGTVGSDTPWKDAFAGPVGENGERNFARHLLTGGLQGALGRGLAGQIGNWVGAPGRQRAAEFAGSQGVGSGGGIDRQLAAIADRVNPNVGSVGNRAPSSRPPSRRAGAKPSGDMGPEPAYTVPSYGGGGGGSNSGAAPTVPGGGMRKPPRSTRLASAYRLGVSREGMNALRDMAALSAMGIGRNDDMER